MPNPPLPDLANILNEIIPHAHYVGGIVRNSLLKRSSGDIDIALPAADVKRAALALAKRLQAASFEMDPELGVWRLVTHEHKIQIDLTAYQGKNLTEDLRRRDFAFNSLAYPVSALPTILINPREGETARIRLTHLKQKSVVDKTGGLADLFKKIIRQNDTKRFQDDPLRMLRAFRMAAELNFSISKDTLAQIQKDRALITHSAGERVREELERLFSTPRAYKMLRQMDKCRLLTVVLPELEEQRNCAEVYYGKGGVLKHTLLVVKRVEYLLTHLHQAFPKFEKQLTLFVQNKALYKMAALLHDVAKPATARIQGDRLRFFYHEQRGARMAQQILSRLHYSRADMRLIRAMIGEHLRPSNLASNNVMTDRGIYHFFRDLKEAAIPMLLLCWGDYTSYVTDEQLKQIMPHSSDRLMTIPQAQRLENVGKTLRHLQVLWFLFQKYFEQPQKVCPTRLVTGKEVMDLLKIEPGILVGKVLERVAEAQAEGIVNTREEALNFIKQYPIPKKSV